MENHLHTLGDSDSETASNILGTEDSSPLAKLSRRGFIALSASLASCTAAEPLRKNTPALASVKTKANGNYQTPKIATASAPLKANFSNNVGITVTRVVTTGNYVAMTFDDGPHPENTPRLLDMLKARNIKATFYVIGNNVNLYPGVLRRTVQEGHEIGNHTQTHRLLSKLSDTEVRSELTRCKDAIGRVTGIQPRTMRPPYGGLNQRQRVWVNEEFGYPTVLWSVDPLDWKKPGAGVITSRILAGASAGGIILAHDLHAQTIDAMPSTLDGLIRRGFKFVTVSQLLAMHQSAAPTNS